MLPFQSGKRNSTNNVSPQDQEDDQNGYNADGTAGRNTAVFYGKTPLENG